jgi:cation transport regulator ChaC
MSGDRRDPATAFVFAYGSLVSAASAAETLSRDRVTPRPAVLSGWQRAYTLARDNLRCEKTFAGPDGEIPGIVLALNVELDRFPGDSGGSGGSQVNGALIDVTAAELRSLDRRELRYDRVEVTGAVSADSTEAGPGPGSPVFTYVAKPANHAPEPPEDAVILASYERAVEAAFTELGAAQLEAFRRTTRVCAAPRIEGTLVVDDIPAGNPRAW